MYFGSVKYLLAIINKLLTVYSKNGGCAYDIGCAFSKTLANSTLGPPIKEHFAFWDAGKYSALNALKLVQLLMAKLESIRVELCLNDNNFPEFFDQERIYLDNQLSIHYVEALDKLTERRAEWDLAHESANNALTEVNIGSLEQMNDALKQARIRVNSLYSKLQNTEMLVAHCEVVLSVDQRWVIGGEEYNCFKDKVTLGKYCAALDELECLVVMRLFKLSKLTFSGTGLRYKLHQKISKALQQRSDAIHNAINCYNVQATSLIPPRPKIAWKDITEYSFLGKFDLLRDSHTDVQDKD
ncbi:hypothetical protein BDR03DRAFT_933872 [Suillus americanus]|nr:hypothetical protein BDR03DRAFT_933872 [Suillus americanus]